MENEEIEVRVFINHAREVIVRAENGEEYRLEYDWTGNGGNYESVFALRIKTPNARNDNTP